MSKLEFLNPDGWAAPRGYANGIAAEGRLVALGGQIGWNAEQAFESDDFIAQTEQALLNIKTLVKEAGGSVDDIVRMTWFILDREECLARQKELGAAYQRVMGKHFPAMSMVVVSGLMERRAKVEIEATAVL